jgi:hypothetical protein
MASKSADDDLKKKIKERFAFVKKVVLFVEDLLLKQGRETKQEERRFSVSSVKVLEGFGGFNFKGTFGETEIGGNHVYISRAGINPESSSALFKVYYWQASLNEDDCRVQLFESADLWVEDLKNVMVCRNQIIKQLAARKKEAERQSQNIGKKAEYRKDLEAKAKRLGLL